jgi:putative salt-induced outer membrane protein YdiY
LSLRGNGIALGRLLLLLCTLAAASVGASERAKTDVITLLNGDRVTGRILYAEYGILQVNSLQTGELSIEWHNIRSVNSTYAFSVERLGGQYVAGVLSTDPEGKNLLVGSGDQAVVIPMQEVYRIVPYESDFWQRINGSVALGYNFTKSSDVSQASFDLNARYSDVALEANLAAHFASTHASGDNNSDQSSIASSVYFLRPGPNFWGLLSSLERDQNLGIDGRVLLGAALGRQLYQTPSADLRGIIGFDYQQEWATQGGSSKGSLEGVLGGDWRVFKFSYPKINLDTSLLMYPSVTDAPRFRATLNITLTYKLTDRFSIKLSEYGNYDSRPPAATAETFDYGITTSLSYDFGAVVP